MPRYIDADRLKEQIEHDSKNNEGRYGDEWQFIETIDNMPTADVVEVVRCRDCMHNRGERDKPQCRFTDIARSNFFYCGFGERAEE